MQVTNENPAFKDCFRCERVINRANEDLTRGFALCNAAWCNTEHLVWIRLRPRTHEVVLAESIYHSMSSC